MYYLFYKVSKIEKKLSDDILINDVSDVFVFGHDDAETAKIAAAIEPSLIAPIEEGLNK